MQFSPILLAMVCLAWLPLADVIVGSQMDRNNL
jgi:hypothetical protein